MFNGNENVVDKLLIEEGYLIKSYDVKELITFTEEFVKLTGCTKDKQIEVEITKYEIKEINREILIRIENLINLVEDEKILVENVWIEVSKSSNITYSIYHLFSI
jgi:hypothetical protein